MEVKLSFGIVNLIKDTLYKELKLVQTFSLCGFMGNIAPFISYMGYCSNTTHKHALKLALFGNLRLINNFCIYCKC